MPAPGRYLPHTFPYRAVFVTSVVLCICAAASAMMGIISWDNSLWGYQWSTGLWSGASVLLTGILGIVCTQVRTVTAGKAFSIACIFSCIVSLGTIALSAGGLNSNSRFYGERTGETLPTLIVHSVLLGLGILEVVICVSNDAVCVYYLFVEKHAEMYKVKHSKKYKRRIKRSSDQNDSKRASTKSNTPLVRSSSESRKTSGKKNKKPKSKPAEDAPALSSSDAVALRREAEDANQSSASRNPAVRPASFSTFGRGDASERLSLIVHPGDNMSVADTNRSQTPVDNESCHYAQTLLFEPPLPIEEDEELPPYQVADPNGSSTTPKQKVAHSSDAFHQLRHSNTAPVHGRRRSAAVESHRKSISGSDAAQSREGNASDDTIRKTVVDVDAEATDVVISRRTGLPISLSRPLSNVSPNKESDRSASMYELKQGVVQANFAHSSERFVNIYAEPLGDSRSLSQSLRVSREKRLDRRKRALSAEIKTNKDLIPRRASAGYFEEGIRDRTSSVGSEGGLFASSRIIPTKFSLRTPVRQSGMPHVKRPIPVKSISSLPLFNPPPKPPRTFSVTLEDLRGTSNQTETNFELPSPDNQSGNQNADDSVFVDEKVDVVTVSDTSIKEQTIASEVDVSLSTSVSVGKGKRATEKKANKENSSEGHSEKVNSPNDKSEVLDTPTMTLLESPVVRPPATLKLTNKTDTFPIYAKINKKRDPTPNASVQATRQRSFTIKESVKKDHSDKTTVVERTQVIEDRVTVSLLESNPNALTKTNQTSGESETTDKEFSVTQDLRVQLPPADTVQLPTVRTVKLNQPISTRNDSGTNYLVSNNVSVVPKASMPSGELYGARPKTFRRGLEPGKSSLAASVLTSSSPLDGPNPVNGHTSSSPNGKGKRHETNTLNSALSFNDSKVVRKLPDKSVQYSAVATDIPDCISSTNSVQNQTTSVTPLTISAAHDRPLSAISSAARRQGVLRLPQSHYQRHVTTGGASQPSASVTLNVQNNAPLPNQNGVVNNAPPNGQVIANRPLFSKLL